MFHCFGLAENYEGLSIRCTRWVLAQHFGCLAFDIQKRKGEQNGDTSFVYLESAIVLSTTAENIARHEELKDKYDQALWSYLEFEIKPESWRLLTVLDTTLDLRGE